MTDLGARLKAAREAAGLSLSGMARRTGFSRSYLGNVETGVRRLTPTLIRAYERALTDLAGDDDVKRRDLFMVAASSVVAASLPDVAVDVIRDIAAERSRLLSTVQTSHATDRVIGSLVARDQPCIASLAKWMRRGSPVLRVNSAGILAKLHAPAIDDDVILALKADREAHDLYLQAVVSRVLGMPWDDAGHLATSGQPLQEQAHLELFAAELTNVHDSGARWCSTVMLARTRCEDRRAVDTALSRALPVETCRENLRTMAGVLAGLSPLSV